MDSAENIIASHSDARVSGSRRKPVCYSELPEVVMNNIFRCLPLNDLINIRNVCDLWKELTERSSTWRHVPLELYNLDSITNLSFTPYIHTVTGNISETELCVNAMVNNLKDLRRLYVCFRPYITAVQVFNLVSKFKNLECISLDFSAPDILETLSVLQNCSNLKEIIFVTPNYSRLYNWRIFFDKLYNIKSLNIFDLYPFFQYVTSSDVLYLLDLIMKQLVSLKVFFGMKKYDISSNISTIVSKVIYNSDRLEKLNFSVGLIKLPQNVSLNFSKIKNLKYLNLWLPAESQQKVLSSLTFPATLESIEIYFSNTFSTCRILERIIMSCPNLKYLKVSNLNASDTNEQLEHLYALQNLHTVVLVFCHKLTNEGLQHISKCSKLKCLTLIGLSNLDYDCLNTCKYLTINKF